MNYTSWSINITRHNSRDNDSVLIAQKLMYEHVFVNDFSPTRVLDIMYIRWNKLILFVNKSF